MKTFRFIQVTALACLVGICTGLFPLPARAAPQDFTKTYPLDAASHIPTSLTLQWAASSGAIDYDYCLETPADGSCNSWTTGLTINQAPVSGLTPWASYEWQVRANDSDGRTTYANGGALWSFDTNLPQDKQLMLPIIISPGPPPDAFGKLSPANGAGAPAWWNFLEPFPQGVTGFARFGTIH